MSIFGSATTTTPLGGSTAARPSLFGSSNLGAQSQPQQSSLFGASQQQASAPQPFSLSAFGGQPAQPQNAHNQTNSFSLLGQSQPQPQQQSAFGQSQPSTGSLWQQSGSTITPRQKSVQDRIDEVFNKWMAESPNCVFQHYFYNKVPDEQAVYYRPSPQENEQKWEEALSKKPGKGYVPVLCVGFKQLSDRVTLQTQIMAALNRKLHEINNSLTIMLQNLDLSISIRADEVRRKHVVLSQRALTLASKVQVLRNRGYAMGSDEEELKKKLLTLEKAVSNPTLGGRAEEIWARMVAVRQRARLLQQELDKAGNSSANGQPTSIDPVILAKAEKILEDYAKQLVHLQKELDQISDSYKAWQGDDSNGKGGTAGRR